jgi:hypothetical protein
MGENFKESRRATLTLRCAWCGFIQMGGAWGLDRRRSGDSKYSHGICPACKKIYF